MTPAYVNEEHGGLILAIDIRTFTDLKKFKKSVGEMCKIVRSQKPAVGKEKITIPGDRSYQRVKDAFRRREIEVDDKLIKQIKEFI